MFLTVKKVDYLANLTKLELSGEEKTKLQRELDKIISYIDQLKELESTYVSPTSHAVAPGGVIRVDKVLPSLTQDQALANAPRKKDGFIRLPRVIG